MLGFYYDSSVCTGCRTCVVACKDKNDLPADVNFRRVTTFETGEYPNVRMYHLSLACNHCENPACVRACSSGALFVDDDGAVRQRPVHRLRVVREGVPLRRAADRSRVERHAQVQQLQTPARCGHEPGVR